MAKKTRTLQIESRTLATLREQNNGKRPNLSLIVNSVLARWVKREQRKHARNLALAAMLKAKERARTADIEGREAWKRKNAARPPRKTASLSLTAA